MTWADCTKLLEPCCIASIVTFSLLDFPKFVFKLLDLVRRTVFFLHEFLQLVPREGVSCGDSTFVAFGGPPVECS